MRREAKKLAMPALPVRNPVVRALGQAPKHAGRHVRPQRRERADQRRLDGGWGR